MSGHNLDPDRAAMLAAKYVHPAPNAQNVGAIALAEQLSQNIIDLRRAAEGWNADQGLAWLNHRTPRPIARRVDEYFARLREAQRRESRGASGFVSYFDDRNRSDYENGWPVYDPDCPAHGTVPLGHALSGGWRGVLTVHVLRGGTGEHLFGDRDHLGDHDRLTGDKLPPWAGLVDYGYGYSFATFMLHVKHMAIVHWCDLRLPKPGCTNGIGGGKPVHVAVVRGRDVFAVSACPKCLTACEPGRPGEPLPLRDAWGDEL